MNSCKCLVFVATDHSPNSKWMPWELGYFDGYREKVAILPILKNNQTNRYSGTEYLGIYPYITRDDRKFNVRWQENNYISFTLWLR
jgi:hypothetical protein